MQKRGISPLLATVLVTGIIIAVATVVFLWSKQVTEGVKEKQGEISTLELSCTNVKVDVADTSSDAVTVENKGQPIDGIILVAKGGGKTGSTIFDDPLDRGSSRSFPYNGLPNVPNVERVTIIPALGKGIYRPCSEQKVEVNI